MPRVDLGRGAAYGALAGFAYGPVFGLALLLVEHAGPVDAGGLTLVVGGVAGLAGLFLGLVVAALALAVRHLLDPGLGGPLVAGVGWTLPWLFAGPGHEAEALALFYGAPLVLGCLAARRWGTGVRALPPLT